MPEKTCRTCADYRESGDGWDNRYVRRYCNETGDGVDPSDVCTCHSEQEATE